MAEAAELLGTATPEETINVALAQIIEHRRRATTFAGGSTTPQ